jgi:hypothetical protein
MALLYLIALPVFAPIIADFWVFDEPIQLVTVPLTKEERLEKINAFIDYYSKNPNEGANYRAMQLDLGGDWLFLRDDQRLERLSRGPNTPQNRRDILSDTVLQNLKIRYKEACMVGVYIQTETWCITKIVYYVHHDQTLYITRNSNFPYFKSKIEEFLFKSKIEEFLNALTDKNHYHPFVGRIGENRSNRTLEEKNEKLAGLHHTADQTLRFYIFGSKDVKNAQIVGANDASGKLPNHVREIFELNQNGESRASAYDKILDLCRLQIASQASNGYNLSPEYSLFLV